MTEDPANSRLRTSLPSRREMGLIRHRPGKIRPASCPTLLIGLADRSPCPIHSGRSCHYCAVRRALSFLLVVLLGAGAALLMFGMDTVAERSVGPGRVAVRAH